MAALPRMPVPRSAGIGRSSRTDGRCPLSLPIVVDAHGKEGGEPLDRPTTHISTAKASGVGTGAPGPMGNQSSRRHASSEPGLITPEGALAALRFVDATALMGVWGSCAYLGTLVPRALAAAVADQLRRWRTLAVAV